MTFTMKSSIKIFSGSNSEQLANKIAKSAGLTVGNSSITKFSDGEFETAYEETVRGSQVFIIQSTYPPTDNLMELLLMIDAAKRASAYKVCAVIPYFGFARQDRKDRPRVAIGARLVANLLMAAGVDRVMTMDLHADQIQGFFDIPVDHLYGSSILLPYIEKLKLNNLCIASPDMGGSKRAHTYARYLHADLAICHKRRVKANVVGEMTAIGEVEGKNIVIVDDMIDTAGTIAKAADMLKNKGAKSIRAVASHAVLSGPAYERIEKSALEEVVFTNSIPLRKESSKIKSLSVADIFAKTITNVYNCESISSNFII